MRCRVTEIREHGGQVYSIFLKPEKPAPHFLPGQYLNLTLEEVRPGAPWPDSRSFSIASAPAERRLLRITYAVKSQFTARMEAGLRIGSPVWVNLPFGTFIINPDREVCLLAGGTGVTAFSGFLTGLSATYPHNIHLFYGARQPGHLIYRPLVEAAAQRCQGVHVHYFAEQDFTGTDCLPGRIEMGTVFRSIPEPLTLAYYLAGPPEMIQSLSGELSQRGVPAGQVNAEAWA